MRRSSLIACVFLSALVVLAVGAGGSFGAGATSAASPKNDRITICHATGNGKYVSITISVNGLNGHDGHTEDIIPPHGSDPGRNWDEEGQAIWENGCVKPTPPQPTPKPIGVFASTTCDSNGTFSATFGYTSENEVEVSIPVGPDNFAAPGSANQGQPTTFQPGTVTTAFTVTGIPGDVTGSWTVRSGGETRSVDVSRPADCDTPPPPSTVVSVTVSCVDRGATTYTARFGYTNPGRATLSVPAGSQNRFTPAPVDRGQPIAFEPGRDPSAVEVSGIPLGTSLTWTLKTGGTSSTATASDAFPTACSEPPLPELKPVSIFVTCVDAGPTTFAATYGYLNPNATSVTIGIGADNRMSPRPENRGQPTTFLAGRVGEAFTVTGIPNGTNLVWILNGKTSTASSSFPTRCTEPPPLPPTETDQPIGVFVTCVTSHGATYDATFGYQNDNGSTVTVPAGSANGFTPAPTDRGQVTQFLPGNVGQAFTVKGVPRATQLKWTVTHAGAGRSATASSAFERACGEAPEPAGPIGLFACVTPRGSTYDITFGYVNENPVAVGVPVGIANAVLPEPVDRGQPELFAPGRVEDAFTVKGVPAAGRVVWRVAHLGTKLLVVSASHPVRCGSPATLPVQVFPLCSLRTGNTYVAAFGYLNAGSTTIRVRRGSQNAISPAPFGGAQPEVFLPGLTAVAFAIRDVPLDRKVTWSVETLGIVDRATASSGLADCRTIAVGGSDLSVTKTATPRRAAVGDRIEYSITVRNAGTRPATQVTLVDRPFGGLVDLRSVTTSQGACEIRRSGRSGKRVVCRLGTVGPEDTVQILVAARAVGAGNSRNLVTVLGASGGSVSNNVAAALVVIRQASDGSPSPPFTG